MNRKHRIILGEALKPVKDFMRENQNLFTHINGVPTSEQIGTVLQAMGYRRSETETHVLYEM